MEDLIRVNINYKVSLVIMLIDDFTSKLVSGASVFVSIKEVIQKPVKKNQACFVFTNLDLGIYNVCVKSSIYFEEIIAIDLNKINPSDPVIYIRLKPLPMYPFENYATLVRLLLKDSAGNKIQGAKITAVVKSDDGSKAKIIQDKISKGNTQINLLSQSGLISVGEDLYINDEKKSEYCKIKKIIDYDKGIFEIEKPLKHEHKRGTCLMPVVNNNTDYKGEAVIYFMSNKLEKLEVQLIINHGEISNITKITADRGNTLTMNLNI